MLPFGWHWRLPTPVCTGAPVWRWWGFPSMASLGCPAPHTDPPGRSQHRDVSSLNCSIFPTLGKGLFLLNSSRHWRKVSTPHQNTAETVICHVTLWSLVMFTLCPGSDLWNGISTWEEMTCYLIEMRQVWLPEVKLLFLSEPAELRFDHSLVSAERRQIEEVKPLSSVACGCKKKSNTSLVER